MVSLEKVIKKFSKRALLTGYSNDYIIVYNQSEKLLERKCGQGLKYPICSY